MYLYLCLYLYFWGSVSSDTKIHWLWGHWTPAFAPVLYFNLNLYLYFYGSPIPWVDRKVEGHLHFFLYLYFSGSEVTATNTDSLRDTSRPHSGSFSHTEECHGAKGRVAFDMSQYFGAVFVFVFVFIFVFARVCYLYLHLYGICICICTCMVFVLIFVW